MRIMCYPRSTASSLMQELLDISTALAAGNGNSGE